MPNNPNNAPEPNEQQLFDIDAAHAERRRWRLGGEMPTERALGVDASLAREVDDLIDEAKDEVLARRQRLRERLGSDATEKSGEQ